MSYKVAVVGATGNVGREILNILAERKFPVREVVALASARSRAQGARCQPTASSHVLAGVTPCAWHGSSQVAGKRCPSLSTWRR